MKNAAAYKRCLADAESIALARDGIGGEDAAIAIRAECMFAEWAGVSVSAIRAAAFMPAVFTYKDRIKVVVKCAAFDPESPRRRVSMFVPKDELEANLAHVYVLWSVGFRSEAAHPVGWVNAIEARRATVGAIAKARSHRCHIVPQSQLRPVSALDQWIRELLEPVGDGVLDWWIDKRQAAVRVNGKAVGIVYRGASQWHAYGVNDGFASPREAGAAALQNRRDFGPCAWPW